MKSTAKLMNGEDVLKILSEQAPVGACVMQDGRFCYLNSFFSSATGYTADELVGKDSLEIVVPEDREMVRENTLRMLKGELLSPYQFRVTCKDGSIVWVMATVKSIQYRGRRATLGNYMEVTERSLMEHAVKESEEKYRELANSITDVFFAMDERLRYTYWNRASEVLTEIPAEDAVGRSLSEIFPDKPWRRRAEKVYRSVLRTQKPQTFVNDYDIDGRHYVLEINAYPSRGGVSVFVKDITEHKQAEDARREAEKEKSALLEEAPVGIVHTDLKGKIIYVNQRFESESGYSRGEVIGRSGFQLDWFPAGTLEFLAERMAARLGGSPAKHWETQFKCKDGRWIWIELEGRILERSGVPVGFQLIAANITERKQAEEKLRESEQKYRLLFETSPDYVTQLDREGRYLAANPATARSLGVPLEALIGKTVFQVMPEEIAQLRLENMRRVLDEGHAQVFEDQRAGRYFHHIVVPLKTSDQEEAVQVITRDITEHKQAEEALQVEKNKLQSLVDAMEDTVTIQDTEYNIIYQNEPSRMASGGDHVGEKCYRVYEHRETVCEGCPVETAFKDGKSHTAERMTTIRGTVTFWENTANPIRDAQGKIASCLELTRDITERKKQEQALADELTQRRLLIDKSLDGIVVLDVDARVVEANQRFAEMLGYTLDEVRELHTWDWDKNFAPEQILEMGRNVDEKGLHLETKHTRKDGSAIDVDISISGIRYGGQKLIFCIQRDVTEHKQAEEALKQSEERYRTILEEMEDAYSEVDLAGNFTFVNNAVCRDLGYSMEELIGKSINYKDFTVEEDIESVFRAFNEVYRTGVPNKGFPWKTIRKDGSHGFAETSISLLRNGRGEIIGFRCVGRDITERKQIEEKLRQSKERYRALFDNSVTGTLVVDAETTKVVIGNQAAVKMFGFSSAEEGAGVNLLDFVPAEEREKDLERIKKELFEQDSRRAFDLQAVTKDGRTIWISATGAKITHGGRLAGLLSFTDITERKQAEEALRQSEEKYRTILKEMEDSYFEVDLGGHLTFVNSSTCRNLGYSEEELIGMSYKCFTATEDIESVFRVFNEVYRSGVPNKGFPWEIIRKDGGHGFAEASISLLRSDTGEIIGFRGVGRDITERKQAEEKLRQSEENYKTLFNSSVIGTIVVDAETMRVVMANQAAVGMFRFSSPDEIRGMDPLAFIHPEDREEILELATKSLVEQDSHQTHNLRAITKDGREIWISATGARIKHEDRLAGLISFADITEQKRQNERLVTTDRLASIGELAAGAAHELNNPLTSIIGFSELLMERDTPDYIRKDLAMIRSEAQRAANVTSNLLTFARKHRPVKQPTQIDDVIEEVLKLRAYAHKSNCIEVERHLASDLPEIPTDRFQMQQVFLNIVINAEYFMTQAHKRGTLIITTKRQNGSVAVSFADDGPGIPAENLGRLFDPFFTTKEAGKGTGLGLSICHGIVAEHGGQIYATSQPGKGATIFIELPINGSNHVKVML